MTLVYSSKVRPGNWLLMAAKANVLLQQAKCDDPDFLSSIDTLEVLHCLDFGIMGTVFMSQFVDKEFQTFVMPAMTHIANPDFW